LVTRSGIEDAFDSERVDDEAAAIAAERIRSGAAMRPKMAPRRSNVSASLSRRPATSLRASAVGVSWHRWWHERS
jgi:hypothetical protein